MTRLLVVALGVAALAGCGGGSHRAAPGSPDNGHRLIVHYGCGACHRIGGVESANGHVGPSLHGLPGRQFIAAGALRNTPANVVRWIVDPQRIVPGSDMPVLGVSPAEARDIVAYLYTTQ